MMDRPPSNVSEADAATRSDEVPLAWIIAVLLRDRRLILWFTAIAIAAALVMALSRRPMYTSSFAFIPQSSQDQGRSGLASLAGQFGINLGSIAGPSQPPQLYQEVLKTRELLSGLATDTVSDGTAGVPLYQFLGAGTTATPVVLEETMRKLRERVMGSSVDARTTGAVKVWARTRSAAVSFQIAQAALDGLNRFNRVTRQSQAGEERRFTEGRLDAARLALRQAEDSLQEFLQANRQFSTARLRLDQDRLERSVSLRQQVFTGLAQQYEDARIREVRDTPVITVIERPALPVLPDPRGRVRLLIVLTFIGFSAGASAVLAREGWRRRTAQAGGDPSYALLVTEWKRLRAMFSRG